MVCTVTGETTAQLILDKQSFGIDEANVIHEKKRTNS